MDRNNSLTSSTAMKVEVWDQLWETEQGDTVCDNKENLGCSTSFPFMETQCADSHYSCYIQT